MKATAASDQALRLTALLKLRALPSVLGRLLRLLLSLCRGTQRPRSSHPRDRRGFGFLDVRPALYACGRGKATFRAFRYWPEAKAPA